MWAHSGHLVTGMWIKISIAGTEVIGEITPVITVGLIVIWNLASHPLFRVSGRDLVFDLALTPWEAILGATIPVRTLGGEVALTVKPGTTAGQKMRLSGRGLPSLLGNPGDLYALVKIVVPAQVSKAEQELYSQLAAVSNFNPRA